MKWTICAGLGFLVLVVGCRTAPPNVKPPNEPEVIRVPPALTRYDTPEYPKQAFADRQAPKKLFQTGTPGPVLPAGGMGNNFGPVSGTGLR